MINKNRYIFSIGILILLTLSLVYAGNYDAGNYNANNYNVGEVPASSSSSGGGSSRRGSSEEDSSRGSSSLNATTNTSYECSLDSDCNETQYCFENTCHKAECFNDSVCNVETGESCWNYRCVKLFDVAIKDFESPIKLGEFFEFTYLIKGMANISDDVEVHFWIEKDGKVITSGQDTIYLKSFEEKIKTTKLSLPTDTPSGTYIFFVQLVHGTYKANSHRTIEITVNDGLAKIGFSSGITTYIISTLIGFFASILLIIFYLERRKMKRAIISEVRWIKKYKITLSTFFVLAVLGALINYFKWYEIIADWSLSIASQINPYLSSYGYDILAGIVSLISLIILITIARKKRWWKKFKGENRRKKKEMKVKTQIIKRKENIENRKNIKKFFRKYKVLLSVILLSIILAGIITYLFYVEVLTVEELENLLNSFVSWVKIVWEKIVSLF